MQKLINNGKEHFLISGYIKKKKTKLSRIFHDFKSPDASATTVTNILYVFISIANNWTK